MNMVLMLVEVHPFPFSGSHVVIKLFSVRDAEIPLRNALCVADYAKVEVEELRARADQDAEQIASYCAEMKKLKVIRVYDSIHFFA